MVEKNNREAGDLRRYRAHYDVIVMLTHGPYFTIISNLTGTHTTIV